MKNFRIDCHVHIAGVGTHSDSYINPKKSEES